MVTQWSPGASRSVPPLDEYSLGVCRAISSLEVFNSLGGGVGFTRGLRTACGWWIKELGTDAAVRARRWASAWARTLAKPAGFVMRAAWPASELAQRLHSSNSTA